MASYDKLNEFKIRIKNVNNHFEKHKNSSLHNLIIALNADPMDKLLVLRELIKIPQGKVLKYSVALQYLLTSYPGLHAGMLPWGPLRETNAAKFPKTLMPVTYNPANNQGKEIVVGTPPTSFLDKTCETFLLTSLENNGIILIHLGHSQPAMNNVYNGKKVTDHINSVLRIAKATGTPVCALHMHKDLPVCSVLKDAFDDLLKPKLIYRSEGHMGSVDPAFREFVSTKDNCVVMGFDGTICVHANIFGSPEYLPGMDKKPAPPLITLTNVITSRAVLVTSGGLYPKDWSKLQYGVLHGTG